MSDGWDDGHATSVAPDATSFRSWFLDCGDALALISAETRIIDANVAFSELVSVGLEELRGADLESWLEPHPVAGPLSAVLIRGPDRVAERGIWDGDWTFTGPDGGARSVRLLLARSQISPNRGPVWLAWVRAGTDSGETARQRQVADQLATVGLLAGSAAHEIKNDLAPLVGYLSLLEDSDSEGMVALMRESVRRIQEHVEGILEPLRPRVRARGPVVLAAALADTTAQLKRAGRLRRLVLEISVADDVVVHADKAEVAQLLLNLLTNAADALGDGGGGMRGTIEVDAVAAEGMAHIRVQDSGRGLDPMLRHTCFHDFTSTKAGRGTGLGLPVARDIVRALGGTIAIEPLETEGTRVVLRLPLYGSPEARY